ncbi:MBL fold metallo-hydrolase [Oceanobacillus piezotolerans]|uniref:MBL fold metallo-hydrolase n=1 Tax=Oceanobacillus piezotolerans TaxID=2448030 RepID=A0A498DAH5_9BACI|nr:MBL fold metallo-hydrolase [Oceanobacillus piezotolerans]RLL45030.1 MBL fold metallo-hydrolase [Oceanobacillus piezotolerans]
MKVTVVGYWGGYPTKDGATSAYLLEHDNFTLLIDAGSGSLSKLQKYKAVSDLDAVILSHYHHDHTADIGVLQYARLIHYYVTESDTVLPIYGHTEDKEGFGSLTHNFTKGIAYQPGEALKVGPFTITFMKTKHPVPCYGMRISDGKGVLVYTADSSYTEDWIDFAKDSGLLIADCNYYAGQDGSKAGHMNSQEVGQIAERAKVESLILSHLPQFGDRSQLLKEAGESYKGKLMLAEEGLTWEG